MCGDRTNDAPTLAQADLGIAMNHGTAAAREAGNMIDLDSDPFKLMEVIRVGRQLLRTRRALGIFVIAADAAKFLTVILAVLAASYPQLSGLSYLRLSGPGGAVLSTLIFSVVLILALVPPVLGGLRRRLPRGPARPEYDYVFHGLLGLVTPMVGIKLIDSLVNAAGFV
jgi:K+-transporting ATPase ATPase B chain